MRRAPSLASVHAAEMGVQQAARQTRDSLLLAHGALRAAITRPSTLMMAVAGTGLLGWWLAGRRSRQVKSSERLAAAGRKRAFLGSVLAFVLRNQLQGLPSTLVQIASAWRRRAATAANHPAEVASAQYAASR